MMKSYCWLIVQFVTEIDYSMISLISSGTISYNFKNLFIRKRIQIMILLLAVIVFKVVFTL